VDVEYTVFLGVFFTGIIFSSITTNGFQGEYFDYFIGCTAPRRYGDPIRGDVDFRSIITTRRRKQTREQAR
jgi:hypothetical protein